MNKKWEKFERILRKKRADLINRVTTDVKTEKLHLQTEEFADETDNATQHSQHEMTSRMLDRDNLFVRKIDAALARMQEGNYGGCEYCGDEIAERRLEVQPWATHCVVHAELLEKKSTLRRA